MLAVPLADKTTPIFTAEPVAEVLFTEIDVSAPLVTVSLAFVGSPSFKAVLVLFVKVKEM